MATAEGIETLTVEAGELVPIYRFLQLQTDGQYDLAGLEERADGVSAEAAAAAGDILAMAELRGVMKVESGAAVTVGALVSSDATGRAQVAAAAGAATFVLGVARTATAAAGEIVEVQLHLFKNNAS